MFNLVRVAVMTGLWVLSATLMVLWSLNPARIILGGWSLFIALMACLVTVSLLLSLERHRIETIAQLVVDGASSRSKLESL